MKQSVVEAHSALYHYTNAAGLHGIIADQNLRATNIAFLNDAEEHIGYFNRRLPRIVDSALREGLMARFNPNEWQERQQEICDAIAKQTRFLVGELRDVTLRVNEPYITSFSKAPMSDEENDGVLSQWQSYGIDGGYAIVFDTASLENLLRQENERYQHQIIYWGDVEYYNSLGDHVPVHSETIERENVVRDTLIDTQFTEALKQEMFEPMFEPISILSSIHKHKGFQQESEVRIVAILTNDVVAKEAFEIGDHRHKKQVHFITRNGVPVPFIKLFESAAGEPCTRLPIKKVIVGPHKEKHARQSAVKLLLEKHNIDADVVISDIPYIGR